MWLALNGFGFVDSFDGFSPRVEVRHEELLVALAQDFAAHDHDLKWLMRTIVLSRLFQLEHGVDPLVSDSHVSDSHVSETWHAMPPRRLNGDQWLDSVVRVTGEEQRIYALADEIALLLEQEHADRVAGVVPWDPGSEQTDKAKNPPPKKESIVESPDQLRLKKLRKEYAEIGKRVAQLRARARIPMSPTAEALMSMNGEIVAASLQRGTVATAIAKLPTRKERIEAGFLAVLGRRPRDGEWQIFPHLATEDPMANVSDLLWTLMQATEFQTY